MNFEFVSGNAKATIFEGKKVKLDGDKEDKKKLKQLQPLFDAILNADKSGKKNKLDSGRETSLMVKLEHILMADGNISDKDLDLGKEFQSSGKTIDQFINDKLKELQQPKEVNVEEKKPEAAVAATEVKQEVPPSQQQEEKPSTVEGKLQAKPVTSKKPVQKPSSRAYNQTIQTQKNKIASRQAELEAKFTQKHPVQTGETLFEIARDSLKAELGREPKRREIDNRVAELALINNINNVDNIKVGRELKVPAGTPSNTVRRTVPNGKNAKVETVPQSSITPQKPITETLEKEGYTATEKAAEGEGGIEHKEWAKEGKPTVYTTDKGGVNLYADSLENLKKISKEYDDAVTVAAPANESEDAKKARQTKNLENMRKRIELVHGDINAIKAVISELKSEGNVDPAEAQSLVQDLIRTKNVEVLSELLLEEKTSDNNEKYKALNNSILNNDQTSAETVTALYSEIRQKENAGIKLSAEEIELKEFLQSYVTAKALYTIEADTEKGIAAKEMKVGNISGEIYYETKIGELYFSAGDPKILDEFTKDLNAADTDEKKTAVFAKYAETKDKSLAISLADNANNLKASKDDVLKLVNNNDMYIIKNLQYTPSDADKDAVDKAISDRVVEVFKAGKGDPANMQYLYEALLFIDNATYDADETKNDEEKTKREEQILDTFFNVKKNADGTKSYTFNPSRRPTYEEMQCLVNNTSEAQSKAILDSVQSIDDLGKGQYTQVLETKDRSITDAMLKAKYEELFEAANIDPQKDPEGAKKKVLEFIDAVGPNIDLIPFNKIKEKFGDVEFVKEHIGPVKNENNVDIDRKLTILDIEVVKEENGSYKAEFSIAADYDAGYDSTPSAHITITGATEAEVLEKAEKYIRVQNICRETVDEDNYTDTEEYKNLNELNEIFKNGDKDLQKAIALVAAKANGVYDEQLANQMIDTNEYPTAIAIADRGDLPDSIANRYVAIALDKKPENKFQAGTMEGNELIYSLAKNSKITQEQKVKIYNESGVTNRKIKIALLNNLDDKHCNYAQEIKKMGPILENCQGIVNKNRLEKAGMHLVKKGEALETLVVDYMYKNFMTNPDMFPQLKESVEDDEKDGKINTWEEKRIKNALQDYYRDFAVEIQKDLRLDPTKKNNLQIDRVIDFNDIKWKEHQPKGWEYTLYY